MNVCKFLESLVSQRRFFSISYFKFYCCDMLVKLVCRRRRRRKKFETLNVAFKICLQSADWKLFDKNRQRFFGFGVNILCFRCATFLPDKYIMQINGRNILTKFNEIRDSASWICAVCQSGSSSSFSHARFVSIILFTFSLTSVYVFWVFL